MNRMLPMARETALATGIASTTGSAMACTGSGNGLHHYDPIAYAARKLWPAKTAEHLAAYLGCSLRTAKYLLSPGVERKAISVRFFKRMFLGEHSEVFVKAWMSASDAEWWQALLDLEQQADANAEAIAAVNQAIGKIQLPVRGAIPRP